MMASKIPYLMLLFIFWLCSTSRQESGLDIQVEDEPPQQQHFNNSPDSPNLDAVANGAPGDQSHSHQARSIPPIDTTPLNIDELVKVSTRWLSPLQPALNTNTISLTLGSDNIVELTFSSEHSEALTLFNLQAAFNLVSKPEPSPFRPLLPQRILASIPPKNGGDYAEDEVNPLSPSTLILPLNVRPELEPGSYHLTIYAEIIDPQALRLHRLIAFQSQVTITDPYARFLDVQTMTIILLLILTLIMAIPALRKRAIGFLLRQARSFKRQGGFFLFSTTSSNSSQLSSPKETSPTRDEDLKSQWIPAHVKQQQQIKNPKLAPHISHHNYNNNKKNIKHQ